MKRKFNIIRSRNTFLLLFPILLLLLTIPLPGQQTAKPIAEKLARLSQLEEIERINPFRQIHAPDLQERHMEYISGQIYLDVIPDAISTIVDGKPFLLTLDLPFPEGNRQVELYRVDIFSPSYRLRTSDGGIYGPQNEYSFYRGIISGIENSVVALSILGDELRIILSDENGNYRIQRTVDNHYLAFHEGNIRFQKPFECRVDDSMLFHSHEEETPQRASSAGNCVEIYFETDLATFQEHNSSVSETEAYIAAIFNEVATIYENEEIPVSISEIFVWTTTDPYAGFSNPGDILDEFSSQIQTNGYSGRLAHFVSTRSLGGGVAWVNVLCSSSVPTAVSTSLSPNVVPFPSYSWNVEVVAHEMGHNFGSRHTHRCTWNGNNTQIDDCGNVYADNNNQNIEGAACYDDQDPILPSSGTIMSYCHLISGVGINFNNGFGSQPGNLIRDKYNNASCNTGSCFPPECVSMISPEPGEVEVELDPLILWGVDPGATGYLISLGTVSGGNELLNEENITSGSSYQVASLPSNSLIYVTIVPYNSLGEATGCSSQSFTTGTSFGYCNSHGEQQAGYIDLVGIDGVYYSSGPTQYSNFTNNILVVSRGGSHTLTISPGYPGIPYSHYFRVWIDYNQDDDFLDAGETVYSSPNTNSTVNPVITIPTFALKGETRMRVSMKYGSHAQPCESFSFGEVEDYTLDIRCNLVTNTNASGQGSLLDIIGCVDEGEEILFATSLNNKVISFSGQYAEIEKDLVISIDPARSISISGNNAPHVFRVADGVNATIAGFHIIAGNSSHGSAIYNNGNLILRDLQIEENSNSTSESLIFNGGELNFTGPVLVVE